MAIEDRSTIDGVQGVVAGSEGGPAGEAGRCEKVSGDVFEGHPEIPGDLVGQAELVVDPIVADVDAGRRGVDAVHQVLNRVARGVEGDGDAVDFECTRSGAAI